MLGQEKASRQPPAEVEETNELESGDDTHSEPLSRARVPLKSILKGDTKGKQPANNVDQPSARENKGTLSLNSETMATRSSSAGEPSSVRVPKRHHEDPSSGTSLPEKSVKRTRTGGADADDRSESPRKSPDRDVQDPRTPNTPSTNDSEPNHVSAAHVRSIVPGQSILVRSDKVIAGVASSFPPTPPSVRLGAII